MEWHSGRPQFVRGFVRALVRVPNLKHVHLHDTLNQCDKEWDALEGAVASARRFLLVVRYCVGDTMCKSLWLRRID